MTRSIVYGISFWIFVGAAACTIAAVALPDWITLTSPSDYDPIHVSLGLFKRCSTIEGGCRSYPKESECQGGGMTYCSIWRSAGFFMNFSLVIELACLVAYAVIFLGGRSTREYGWKVVAPLLATVATAQLISMALIAYLFDNDSRFFAGWELDRSWILCTVSWSVLLLDAVGMLAAAYVLPYDDDYEPIA